MGFGDFVGNITGGLLGGKSDAEKLGERSNKISKASQEKQLTALQSGYDASTSWLTPYITAGTEALTSYKSALGLAPDAPVFDQFSFDASKITSNPAYQFVMQQGLQATDRAMAANRSLGSGNRLMALTDYASGLASQEYGNEFQRQLQANQVNNALAQQGFQNQNLLYGQNLENLGYLTSMGGNIAQNQAAARNQLAVNQANVYANRAAEQVAGAAIPIQEKQSFINNLFGLGGAALGSGLFGGAGGGGGNYAPVVDRSTQYRP